MGICFVYSTHRLLRDFFFSLSTLVEAMWIQATKLFNAGKGRSSCGLFGYGFFSQISGIFPNSRFFSSLYEYEYF